MPRTQTNTDTYRQTLRSERPMSGPVVTEMVDQLEGIREVHQAFDLLAGLIDPVTSEEVFIQDLDRKELGALLRILNSAFVTRLTMADDLLAQP